MNIAWKIFNHLDQRSLRERVLVMLVMAVILFIIADTMVFSPQLEEYRRLALETAATEAKITAGVTLKNQLSDQLVLDPNMREQKRLERLRGEIIRLDRELQEKTVAFISPRQMVEALKEMIEQQHNLKLMALKTLQAVPLLEDENIKPMPDGAGTKENAVIAAPLQITSANVYRHSVEMQFKGDYFAVLTYLKKLEDSGWRFEWNAIDITVTKYPVSIVRLQISTLSMAEGWIGV